MKIMYFSECGMSRFDFPYILSVKWRKKGIRDGKGLEIPSEKILEQKFNL